jgi:hypothetical protein
LLASSALFYAPWSMQLMLSASKKKASNNRIN